MTTRVYEEAGTASWFLDCARTALPDGVLAPQVREKAEARLMAHGEEVREQILRGTAEGRNALAFARESVRGAGTPNENLRAIEDAERRAISDTAFSQFSTPQYIVDQWVAYRSQIGSFAAQAWQLVLPDTGVALHVPSFTAGTSTDVDDLELVGMPSSVPTTSYITDPILVNQGKGVVTISQQLLDRGQGPDGQGGAFDVILADQLHEQLTASIDSYVIGVALAGATSVTEATALTSALFWTNLNDAMEQLADTAGARLQPTHIFSTTDFAGWLRRQVDDQHRPLWLPDIGAVMQSEPAGEPFSSDGWQGVNFAGSGGCHYVDDLIPAQATTNAAAGDRCEHAVNAVLVGNNTDHCDDPDNVRERTVRARVHAALHSCARESMRVRSSASRALVTSP